jgi:hypothetical protein
VIWNIRLTSLLPVFFLFPAVGYVESWLVVVIGGYRGPWGEPRERRKVPQGVLSDICRLQSSWTLHRRGSIAMKRLDVPAYSHRVGRSNLLIEKIRFTGS